MLSLRNICLLYAGLGFFAVMLAFCFSNLAILLFNRCFGPMVVPFGSRLRNVQHDMLFFLFLSPERE